MKRLYHYCPKENTARKNGIYSLSRADEVALSKYYVRTGTKERKEIISWLDNTFEGRSRAVSCLTEKINWCGNDPMLQTLVFEKECFSFDLDELQQKGLIEAIWCKEGSDQNGKNENFYQIEANEIDFSPLDWHLCSQKKGMLFGVIRHYMLVLKDGVIPAEYLRKEIDEQTEDK